MLRSLLFSAAILVSSAAAAAPPAKFLGNAIRGDNSEIRLGSLIAARGYDPAVRSFGRTLERDHSTARGQAVAVSRLMRVAVPRSMMPEARAEYAKLQHMRGRAFDREVRRYMIDDHRKDISDFQDEARHGERRTAELARRQLPTLHKHLRIAQSLPG